MTIQVILNSIQSIISNQVWDRDSWIFANKNDPDQCHINKQSHEKSWEMKNILKSLEIEWSAMKAFKYPWRIWIQFKIFLAWITNHYNYSIIDDYN